jgi:hypothetical protein
MKKETEEDYDISSGVYPYEVTDITHSYETSIYGSLSWKNPANKNFHNVRITPVATFADGMEHEMVIEGSVDISLLAPPNFVDLIQGLTSVTFIYSIPSNSDYLIIRCVDKYGNVSEGVMHVMSRQNEE